MVLATFVAIPVYADPGDVIYVDQANDSGTENGSSWATAYTTLADGIEAARINFGGDVWVAGGTYDENRLNGGAIQLRPTVNIYGGFDGTENQRIQRAPLANVTVIDGSTSDSGAPAETVVFGTNNTIMDGFTIQGGQGDNGVGMTNIGVSPVITDCVFTSNTATQSNGTTGFGAGMLNVNGAAPLLTDCVFTNNNADQSGGGMANTDSSPTLMGCRFSINTAGEAGGAIFNNGDSNPVIENCIFDRNEANNGGAIFNESANPVIKASEFLLNDALAFGGALFNNNTADVLVINSVFGENHATTGGGAISNLNAIFTGVNCSIVANTSDGDGGAFFNNESTTDVLNSVIWYNSEEWIGNVSSVTGIRWCNVGGSDPGPNNIAEEPRFTDMDNRDYSLKPDSPNINAATEEGAPLADILGIPRPQDAGVDMGAYEATVVDLPDPPLECTGIVLSAGATPPGPGSGDALLLGLIAIVFMLAGLSKRKHTFI